MTHLRIRRRALEDIRNARDWYEEKLPGLGSRFGIELDTVIRSILGHPEMFRRVHGEVRRAMTRRFPYALYFILEDDRVSILRVLHQARDPREWQQ